MPFVEEKPTVSEPVAVERPEYTPAKRRGQAPAPKKSSRRAPATMRWFFFGALAAVIVFLVGVMIVWQQVSSLFEAA